MSESEKEPPVKIVIVDKISSLVTAAFGFVAALAWNEAIKAIRTDEEKINVIFL